MNRRAGAAVTVMEGPSGGPWHTLLYGTSTQVEALLLHPSYRALWPTLRDPTYDAPLAFAALQRADPLVLHLCETAGLRWDGTDRQRNNAWHWAAPREHMVDWLLERPHLMGPAATSARTLNAPNAQRHSPLMIACGISTTGGENHATNVLALIRSGANVHALTPEGETLLHLIALPSLVGPLIDAGLPVNRLSRNGETPLFRAITLGLLDVVEALLAVGASPHLGRHGYLPLQQAIKSREPEIADRLVNAGADPWRVGVDGDTPWAAIGPIEGEPWAALRTRWEQRRLREALAQDPAQSPLAPPSAPAPARPRSRL